MHISSAQRLNDDVLWTIFLHNADHGKDRAYNSLCVTRISSHVCQSWRYALLGFPTIWGRLLCFQNRGRFDAERTSTEWFGEIFRRSGTAPLWMTADIDIKCSENRGEYLFSPLLLLFQVLYDNWHRVERFDMDVTGPSSTDTHRTLEPWVFLHHPAPLLKTFSLDVDRGCIFLLSMALLPEKLFDGVAPQLEDFASNVFYISSDAIELGTNLRSYTLRRFIYPAPLAFKGVIALVHSAPMLEYIDVESDAIEPASGLTDSIQHRNLPSPTFIRLDTASITLATILFNNITLSDNTNIHVSTKIQITDQGEPEILDSIPGFCRLIIDHGVNTTHKYSSHGPPQLLLADFSIGVEFYGPNSTVANTRRPSSPINKIHVAWHPVCTIRSLASLSEGILSSQLISMPMMRLTITRYPLFLRNLSKFDSLVHLITEVDTLRIYNATYKSLDLESSDTLMPRLQILSLIILLDDDSMVDELVNFLDQRQYKGKPLAEVIFVKDPYFEYKHRKWDSYNLRPLDRFKTAGLCVSFQENGNN